MRTRLQELKNQANSIKYLTLALTGFAAALIVYIIANAEHSASAEQAAKDIRYGYKIQVDHLREEMRQLEADNSGLQASVEYQRKDAVDREKVLDKERTTLATRVGHTAGALERANWKEGEQPFRDDLVDFVKLQTKRSGFPEDMQKHYERGYLAGFRGEPLSDDGTVLR